MDLIREFLASAESLDHAVNNSASTQVMLLPLNLTLDIVALVGGVAKVVSPILSTT